MFTALVSAGTSTSGFSPIRLVLVLLLFAVALPVVRGLRRSASRRRKDRWAREGLLDPPAADPETGNPRD
jgi:hypothetical protein